MSNIQIDMDAGGVIELTAQVDPENAAETLRFIDRLLGEIVEFNTEQDKRIR